jgi:Protein of unknown function (DUF2726)
VDMTPLLPVAAIAGAFVAVLFGLYSKNQQLKRRLAYRGKAWRSPFPPKTTEQERAEHLDRQLEAVIGVQVSFYRRRVMNRGEYDLFRAAIGVTGQKPASGEFPFYVFPQVSFGQIIGTQETGRPESDAAHRAINSKRCDFLIADRNGWPIAVLEYQGSGHNIGGTAERRDRIKQIALERAGVRYVEIHDGASQAEIQQTIRNVLTGRPAA